MPAPSGLPLHLLLVWLHSSSSSPSALSILSVKGKSLMCYLFWVVLRSKSLELFDCNIPLFSENNSYPSRIYALWNEKGLYENIFNEQRKLWCNHWQLFSKVTARSSGKGEVEIGAFSEAPGGACRIWPGGSCAYGREDVKRPAHRAKGGHGRRRGQRLWGTLCHLAYGPLARASLLITLSVECC